MSGTVSEREADARRAPLRMSEEEFVAWCDEDVRAEWVDGEVVMMAPVSGEHEDLQAFLRTILRMYVRTKRLGLVRGPEFQARLSRPSRREPDVLFVATENEHRVRPTYLDGPPDLAMEIVSPESEARDWRQKYAEYEAAGVREYWVISPPTRRIEVYTLGPGGKYQPLPERDGKHSSAVVPGWFLRHQWLWGPDPLNEHIALGELGVR